MAVTDFVGTATTTATVAAITRVGAAAIARTCAATASATVGFTFIPSVVGTAQDYPCASFEDG